MTQSPTTQAQGASDFLGCLPGDLPPEQRVLSLFVAKWTIGALRPLVQLNIPDLLADGPATPAQLAEATGADADSLNRVLRATASAGIFEQLPGGAFGLTPYSQPLRAGVPGSIRDMFLFACDPMLWRPYEELLHTVRTGQPAFDKVFGQPFFDFLRAEPASADVHDRAMIQNHYPSSDAMIDEFDFGRFNTIADVGGGRGQFLADILVRFPGVRGVLADQPQVVVDAKEVFAAAGVQDRVTIVEVDFFAEAPAGCDAYLIKHALHNWSDADAEVIVRRVREAIGDNSAARLLIVDQLLTPHGEWDMGKFTDIEMLAALGGRERTRDEWNRLLARAGFRPANDPAPGALALLEYRPK